MVMISDSIKRLERLKESGLTRDQIEEIDIVIRNLYDYNQEVARTASKEYWVIFDFLIIIYLLDFFNLFLF